MDFGVERRHVTKWSSCVAGELVVAESLQEQKDVAKEDEPIGNISQRLKRSYSVTAKNKSA